MLPSRMRSVSFSVFSNLVDVVEDHISENEYEQQDEEGINHTRDKSSTL